MIPYADASFAVALVLNEHLTDVAWDWLDALPASAFITRLTCLEVIATLHKMHLTRELSSPAHRLGMHRFEQLKNEGRLLRRKTHENTVYPIAEGLVMRFSEGIACKSADIVHAAAARFLRCDTFVTFDHQQGNLARQAGFDTPMQGYEKRMEPPKPLICPHCGNNAKSTVAATVAVNQ